MIKINAELIKRVSKKSGNEYQVLRLTFPNGFVKDLFMDNAELFAIEQNFTK